MKCGDYVFATKYEDGDPADGWAVGFFDGYLLKSGTNSRYLVVDNEGKQFRGNGFRKAEVISPDIGDSLIAKCKEYDSNWGEPGQINLWDELKKVQK